MQLYYHKYLIYHSLYFIDYSQYIVYLVVIINLYLVKPT